MKNRNYKALRFWQMCHIYYSTIPGKIILSWAISTHIAMNVTDKDKTRVSMHCIPTVKECFQEFTISFPFCLKFIMGIKTKTSTAHWIHELLYTIEYCWIIIHDKWHDFCTNRFLSKTLITTWPQQTMNIPIEAHPSAHKPYTEFTIDFK